MCIRDSICAGTLAKPGIKGARSEHVSSVCAGTRAKPCTRAARGKRSAGTQQASLPAFAPFPTSAGTVSRESAVKLWNERGHTTHVRAL
eukprot:6535377-Alexandrium_andersonii.AAC.1